MSTGTLYFEDVTIGDRLPELIRGPMSPLHLMRWSAAIENWHRIHYDWRFATEHEGLPDLLVSGTWKQQFLVQFVRKWVGDNGWLWRMNIQFRRLDLVWDTLTAHGEVDDVRRFESFGVAALIVGIRNSRGEQSTDGRALAAIPYRDGPPVPYPFPRGLNW